MRRHSTGWMLRVTWNASDNVVSFPSTPKFSSEQNCERNGEELYLEPTTYPICPIPHGSQDRCKGACSAPLQNPWLSKMESRASTIPWERVMRVRWPTGSDMALASRGPTEKVTRECGIWGCRMGWVLQNMDREQPIAVSGIWEIAKGMECTST
eukprot:03046_4